jgi:hypothetical protein
MRDKNFVALGKIGSHHGSRETAFYVPGQIRMRRIVVLVLSPWARSTIRMETTLSVRDVTSLADVFYGSDEQAAGFHRDPFA